VTRSIRSLSGVKGGFDHPLAITHWTIGRVAKRLGISVRSVLSLIDRGHLTPIRDSCKQRWFDPKQVIKYAEDHAVKETIDKHATLRARGELHAYIFRRFKEDATIADIVVETREPVEEIRKLWNDYNTDLGEMKTSAPLSEEKKVMLERKRIQNARMKLQLEKDEQRMRERAHEARMQEIDDEIRRATKGKE
jgi:DNA-binding transcriptional MerR regulator